MSAYVGGQEIALTVREFNIIYKLLSYPRRTFSRAQLMEGPGPEIIKMIREEIDPGQAFIKVPKVTA